MLLVPSTQNELREFQVFPLKRALEWINNDLANLDPYDEKRTQTHDFDKCEYI